MKQKKGITLVALVVTVIVLLILAGVSISKILGKDGIISQAEKSVNAYNSSSNVENAMLQNMDSALARYLSGTGSSGFGGGSEASGEGGSTGGLEAALNAEGVGIVAFDLNGGDEDYSGTRMLAYKYEKTVKGLFSTLPTKEGYAFIGWDEDINATEPTYTSAGTTTFEMPEKNIILHAIWKKGYLRADQLEEGMIVEYKGNQYVVLYQEKDNSTKYTGTVKYADGTDVKISNSSYTYPTKLQSTKTQIVSLDSLGSQTLGGSNYNTAKSSWDSAVSTLNKAALDIVKGDDEALETGVDVRCVGSYPISPYNLGGDTDNNYQTDLYQLTKLGKVITDTPQGYWLASRKTRTR